jgi:crotonobetainyl-CoA:carnitine CoA-transferase CaiB-like acyl-CoA transferase
VAGGALSDLMAVNGDPRPAVRVNRDLASAWFAYSIRPQGWQMPTPWDSVSGDYLCSDGWIKLHANAPHHRAAILEVLGVSSDREAASRAAVSWSAQDLETAVVSAGGAAAAMRSMAQWREHPQGHLVAKESLVSLERTSKTDELATTFGRHDRPLERVRVLDLTRVLAGPVATRLLAGWGAEVLRIDSPDWDEPAVIPEVGLGKRCARLDLRSPDGLERFLELLTTTDVLVHGYRADALDRLGLGSDIRDAVRPGLVDVSLDAYGWTGPWRNRRGFDSLVQMSSGIADAGRVAAGTDTPVPLPVQALDHATGYLMAASAITGLSLRATDGVGSHWRMSLARMADLLITTGDGGAVSTESTIDVPEATGLIEHTSWGDARRLAPPLDVESAPLRWTIPAHALGSDEPMWSRARAS